MQQTQPKYENSAVCYAVGHAFKRVSTEQCEIVQ
jgi:hypothetical protein